MLGASASGTFDASASTYLSLRPEVGGGGGGTRLQQAFGKPSLRPQLRKEGIRWSFPFVFGEASTACGVVFRRRVSGRRGSLPRVDMSNYVNDMWPGSPQDKESPSTSRSGRSSRLSSASRSRSSSRSSRSRSSVSSRASSRSRSRPRRRSRSRSRRRHQRKYRRYSRSYSRSRSRSRGRRYRARRYGAPGRAGRSPSRSRSRGRPRHGRAYALARGWRHYGFGRSVHPEERRGRRARARSRSRSRSPSPFRLSEKDRMELLEIAKANAAKALGTANFDLPASLRTVLASKETNRGAAVPNQGAKSEVSILGLPEHDLQKAARERSNEPFLRVLPQPASWKA